MRRLVRLYHDYFHRRWRLRQIRVIRRGPWVAAKGMFALTMNYTAPWRCKCRKGPDLAAIACRAMKKWEVQTMSSSLRWEPSRKSTDTLPYGLKAALRNESQGNPVDREFRLDSAEDMGFLRGLVAAEVEGAKELLDAVEQHEWIRVWEEF